MRNTLGTTRKGEAMLECLDWTVEVDPDQQHVNLEAQESFIVEVVAPLYDELESDSGPLVGVASVHFTRIFNPPRDAMGAYVRLRVFCSAAERAGVEAELDARFHTYFGPDSTLQRRKSVLDWPAVAEPYGGAAVADMFRDHLHQTSRTVSRLLVLKQSGVDIEPLLWPWTHFFFNGARGYGRSVLELAQGAVTGFHENV